MQMMTLPLDHLVSVAAVTGAIASCQNSTDAQHTLVATYTNQVNAYVDHGVKPIHTMSSYVDAGEFRQKYVRGWSTSSHDGERITITT